MVVYWRISLLLFNWNTHKNFRNTTFINIWKKDQFQIYPVRSVTSYQQIDPVQYIIWHTLFYSRYHHRKRQSLFSFFWVPLNFISGVFGLCRPNQKHLFNIWRNTVTFYFYLDLSCNQEKCEKLLFFYNKTICVFFITKLHKWGNMIFYEALNIFQLTSLVNYCLSKTSSNL